ncbi:omega amino acid--pyruvate aminotransferase, partial [Gluconobacter japonicus]
MNELKNESLCALAMSEGRNWLPFSANRLVNGRGDHRVVASAKGPYYTMADGRTVFDTLSGLWCTPLGHGHPRIVEALRQQAETLDFAPGFQMTHAPAVTLAARIAKMAPEGLEHVFFANSGSEAVDT